MEPIYEGKAKRLYTTDNPNVLRMEYKDDATAGNGAKKAQFENKGRMNKAITLVIYRMLESKGVKTQLVDFKIEFGRLAEDPSQIVLADEISPDTCRLWDIKTGEKMDKDRFRQDLGNVMEAYEEVLSRLQNKA